MLFAFRGSPYSSRFAAPYALRSTLKASVNNALLGCTRYLPAEEIDKVVETSLADPPLSIGS